jgi:hypothetical protein
MDPRTALFNINVDTLATICALCDAAFGPSGNDDPTATTDETPLKTLAKQVYGKLQSTDVARDVFDLVQAEKTTALALGKEVAQVKQDADIVMGERERLDVLAKHMVNEPKTLEDWGRCLEAVKDRCERCRQRWRGSRVVLLMRLQVLKDGQQRRQRWMPLMRTARLRSRGLKTRLKQSLATSTSELQYSATIGPERCRRTP